MLVTLKDILQKADKGNYAVIAPDYTTMETVRFQLEVAEKFKAPVILSYTKHQRACSPVKSFEKWAKIIREECGEYDIDACLHLDHGTSVDECKEAIDAGFTGIMMDASVKPYNENVELTAKVVELSHAAGVSVEAELGHVGTAQESAFQEGEAAREKLTQPDMAAKFVEDTGTDCLAVAIGTVHGEYAGEPHIDFELLKMIDEKVSVPLVIHGGSGTGDENIKKAVSLGIRKINVYSDWIRPAMWKVADLIKENPKAVGKMAAAQREVIFDVLGHWFDISSSTGKG